MWEQEDACKKVAKIDVFYLSRFAKFLSRMREIQLPDQSSLLDHSLLIYGSGIADANRHTHDNLPVILAGGGGGTLRPGRYVKAGSQPMSNLFLSIAERMGVKEVSQFGDSTGSFNNI